MRLLRLSILILILCNIPSYLLAYFNPTLGSLSSYASSLLLIAFYFLTSKKHQPAYPFLLLGILYFILSGLNLSGFADTVFLKEFLRFMIVVVCGVEVVARTSAKELFIILLVGAGSIIINAFIFPLANANFYPTYGRYSGFYLNPNFAGTICLAGYALVYAIDKKYLRLAGQILFTLAGILTFSRTFLVIWLVLNVLSILQNRKNALVLLGGLAFFIAFLFYSSGFQFNEERFGALKNIVSGDNRGAETLSEDSRTTTWSLYFDMILDKPLFGSGFKKFQAKDHSLPGVHNSYLMVIGEAGITPFLVMILIYFWLIKESFSLFKQKPEFFYLACVLSISLLASHRYFGDFYNVLLSMFVYVNLLKYSSDKSIVPKIKL